MSNHLQQNIKQTYDTKFEQVDASVRFVLHDYPAMYESLGSLPCRVKNAILTMVAEWHEPAGYHFKVLRAALRQYRDVGYILTDEPPFTDEELA